MPPGCRDLACLALMMSCGFLAWGSNSPGVASESLLGPAMPGPTARVVQFSGLVSTVAGACPSPAFAAGSRDVRVVRTTEFQAGSCADVKRGALVTVDGHAGDDGSVVADRVLFETDGPSGDTLLPDVAFGGYVLFFRHSERDTAALSTATLATVDNAGTCEPGSELTAKGRADASALGERFRRYGITVQKVYASPTCRTVEMARLAFGTSESTRGLLWADAWAPGEVDTVPALLRGYLSTKPDARANVVLISHNDVLNRAGLGVDLVLEQAEAAVFRPLGHGTFELVGRIPKAQWMGRRGAE
jgi:phosphohistidine phosphatase SixA